jgi:phenylacetate-CoA ligase
MMTDWPPEYDRFYIPSPDEKYWHQNLETMNPEEREQTIILPKLQAQLKYAYAHSNFYRKKWDQAGIKPDDIRSFKDFEALPFVTKDEIRQDQTAHPPFGSNICVAPQELARVFGTSITIFLKRLRNAVPVERCGIK